MTRTNPSTEKPGARNLAAFISILTALVLGFTVVTHLVGVDPVAAGPLYMFTPATAGLIVCLRNGIALSDLGLRIGRRRWLPLAAILPIPIVIIVTVLSIGVPGVAFDSSLDLAAEFGLPSGAIWTVVAMGATIAIGSTLNAILAFGEEFGWRGYLLWELAPLGFWKASLVIGVVWGVWHAPLVLAGHNYPSFPVVGVVAFTIACTAMAPLYTYVVVRSKSVLPAAIFHGVFNAAGLVGYAGTDDAVLRQLVASEGGVVGITVFALVSLAIAITGTPHLTRSFSRDTPVEPPDAQTGDPAITGITGDSRVE